VVHSLKKELAAIDADIEQLEERRLRVLNLLETYEPQPLSAKTPNIFSVANPTTPEPAPKTDLTAKAIAIKVLNRTRRPMEPCEIAQAARELGLTPPKSMPVMLWKKASKRQTFFGDGQGKYGLVEWKAEELVKSPEV
jgi:hypothetical protein